VYDVSGEFEEDGGLAQAGVHPAANRLAFIAISQIAR
jgi:hypothetical protein